MNFIKEIRASEIYKLAVETMPKEHIDHWCSDLYLKKTPEAEKLINNYKYRCNVKIFIDEISQTPWYEIPFAYTGEGRRG